MRRPVDMIRHVSMLLAAAVLVAAAPAAAQAEPATGLFGVWRNPKNSVHLELKPCGDGACGVVVWASEKAKADAAEGGTPDLIGLQLFREMGWTAKGGLKGKIFVPDLNRTVSGQAELLDDERLLAKGCVIARLICKAQVWTRAT